MGRNFEIETSSLKQSLTPSGDAVNKLRDCAIPSKSDLNNSQPLSHRNHQEQGVFSQRPVDDRIKPSSLVNGKSDGSVTNLDIIAKRSYTPPLEQFLGVAKTSRILSCHDNTGQANNLEGQLGEKNQNNQIESGKIYLGGAETSVTELANLSKEAGTFDPKIGPQENSMVITEDGSKFKALSISAGGDNHGNKNFLSGAMLQMYIAKFPWFMTKGKSHGVALEAHTHQTAIPHTDPYVFSNPDILYGQGKNWPRYISTDSGCILFKQTGSQSQIPEGCFDSKGGFHRTIKNADGSYSTQSKTTSSEDVKCLPKRI